MPDSSAVTRRKRVGEKFKRLLGGRRRDAAPRAEAGRDQGGLETRVESLEKRLEHLEAMIEGLQDSVHRESVRQGKKIDKLQRDAEPSAIRRALSRDRQERGL
jgi:hypothetical protein